MSIGGRSLHPRPAWSRKHQRDIFPRFYISPRVLALAGLLLVGGILIVLGITRCDDKPRRGREVAVLIDRSQSADDRSENVYRAAIARVVPYLTGGGGRISIGMIDNRSHLRPMEPFDIPSYSSAKFNPTSYESEVLRYQGLVCSKLDEVFSEEPDDPGTAILDAIDNASEALSDLPPDAERFLLALSDMIEESDRLPPINDRAAVNDIDALIAAEQAAGRLPDLDGVDVYVSGAGITDELDQMSERTETWQLFWTRWFEAAGATVRSYGLALSSFPRGVSREPLGCELIFLRALRADVRSQTLRQPLQAAVALVARGREKAACAALDEFDRRVTLKREHGELADRDADDFRERAANIRRLLGCTGADS